MNISVNHVSAGYGGKQVLKDVSISFESGQLTGIIGPNGCGKSTLLKCIYRLLSPWSGDIRIGDTILKDLPYRESAKRVAVLAQHHAAALDELIVIRAVVFAASVVDGDERFKARFEKGIHDVYETVVGLERGYENGYITQDIHKEKSLSGFEN